MTPILEFNVGTANTLPGPIDRIICQSGQGVIVDPTTDPPTTTTLNSDEVFDGEGKAGLQIVDIAGSRWFTESSLENRTDSQMVDTPGSAEQLTDLHGEPTDEKPADEVRGDNEPGDDAETGSYESRSKSALYELAKERGLAASSHDSKAELIEALRGE